MAMTKLSPEVKTARAKRKKLQAPRIADWLAIRALYLGGMKSEEIGKKFGVTGNLIRAMIQRPLRDVVLPMRAMSNGNGFLTPKSS